ncbi:MAG: hypothetical protein ACJAUP_000160 [Cellvibrionaceae bacterium]|jgi:membrane protein implicated in regulation of membrane protease activity
MPLIDQLSLEDIIAPTSVSMWPPAIGWWLLLIIVATLLFFAITYYRSYRKKWGYRIEALNLLEVTMNNWKEKKLNDELAIQHLLTVLKRTAVTAYSKKDKKNTKNIETLYGEKWLRVLKRQASNINYSQELDEIICAAQYQKKSEFSPPIVYKFCKQWIRQHQTQWQGVPD